MPSDLDSPTFDYARAYRDTGCSLAPSCLSCPFTRCRYEGGRLTDRDSEITRLRAQGAATTAIMERFGLSRRSVFRVLQGERR
ncbi:MAG: hypothetical protein WEB52_07125 [Dehalococcoidia bacterium]